MEWQLIRSLLPLSLPFCRMFREIELLLLNNPQLGNSLKAKTTDGNNDIKYTATELVKYTPE